MRCKKKYRLEFFVLFFLFLFISIGYSYLNALLNVTGVVTITPNIKKEYSVNYQNIVDNGYQNSIKEGETLIVTFVDPIPSDVKVYISDQLISDYTFEENTLTVPNINGDVLISGYIYENMDYIFDDDSSLIVDNTITETSGTTVAELMNSSFSAVNSSSKAIKTINVTLTYSSDTGSAQSIKCILTVNGTTYTQIVDFPSKSSGDIVVTFENLNIGIFDEFALSYTNNNTNNTKINITGQSIGVIFME